MTRKHTVTITKPNGDTLTLTGEDVNTCAASGIDRHGAWAKVDEFFGFDEPCMRHSADRIPVVQVEENLFRRGYTLTVAPMVKDDRGVWYGDFLRAEYAQVTVLNDWRK